MNLPVWCTWYAAGNLAGPPLTAAESVALVLLAISILVFRTFREKHLLVWILGFAAFATSGWFSREAAVELQAVSQAAFVVAVCLFAVSILIYTQAQKHV